MNRMKRLTGCILSGAMLLALAACTQKNQITKKNESVGQSMEMLEDLPLDGENSNVLVVYYSATGHTETVAGYIADALGADIFALVPEEPYTSEDLNWRNDSSRVSREHEDPSLRDVRLISNTVDGWDSYDTVFIGYPIWWGIAAWPVDSFISSNDFTGKTVIPFCTSSSSDMGDSGELLAEMAGTGNWMEGERFRSSADVTDVVEWVNGLKLAE